MASSAPTGASMVAPVWMSPMPRMLLHPLATASASAGAISAMFRMNPPPHRQYQEFPIRRVTRVGSDLRAGRAAVVAGHTVHDPVIALLERRIDEAVAALGLTDRRAAVAALAVAVVAALARVDGVVAALLRLAHGVAAVAVGRVAVVAQVHAGVPVAR